ncbi:MAG: hypothetical protein HBSIN02_03540 [Bacteroidia bacterium]|nr:MAG: hypothetical protein HBSIN02_03540 [Bacteroidia bacterium]
MMTHWECEQLFVEALYGELTGPRRHQFDDHLAGCEDCRGAFQRLAEVSALMDHRERSEPTAAEWTAFWNELEDRLTAGAKTETPRNSILDRLRPVHISWAAGIAAVVLVAFGIVIGQRVGVPTDGDLGTHFSTAEKILLNERALNYLERSKVLLLGVVNGGFVEPTSGLAREQEISRSLVTEAANLRQELTAADEQRLKQLIAELEVILLQLANLEQTADIPALEIIRGGVERQGLLLKINLEQMRAQAPPVPADTARKPTTERKPI